MTTNIAQEKPNTPSKHNLKHILFVCLSAVIAILTIGASVGYYNYLYSGCTIKIAKEFENPEKYLIENETLVAYKSLEPFRITSVTQETEVFPEKVRSYTINTNFHNEPITSTWYPTYVDIPATSRNTTFVEFSKREQNIIRSSRNLVINYIKTSEILREKEYLIHEIETVPFFLYTESTLADLSNNNNVAVAKSNGIYCSKDWAHAFCEEVFVHELIHHLSFVAKNHARGRYSGLLFDEAITQIITHQIGPKGSEYFSCSYDDYLVDYYNYFSIFGKDALEAYFYGYDEFFEKYGGRTFRSEHDAFVSFYGKYYDFSFTYEITEAFLATWYDCLYEN